MGDGLTTFSVSANEEGISLYPKEDYIHIQFKGPFDKNLKSIYKSITRQKLVLSDAILVRNCMARKSM